MNFASDITCPMTAIRRVVDFSGIAVDAVPRSTIPGSDGSP